MRAGKMRHRVNIQASTESRDAHGGVTQTWATAVTRWASIDTEKVNEREAGGKTDAIASHVLVLRDYPSLTEQHRILYGTRVFNIVEIIRPREVSHEMRVRAMEQK